MEKLEKFLSKYWWLILTVLSLPAIRALFVPGFYGASDDMHIAWLYEIDKTIKMGQFPPRFVPDLSFGFGYPLFNFVFPLPFYIGEIFRLIGLNLVDSIKMVFGLSVILSGVGMYLLLREFTTNILSLAGAVLYIYAPYRAVDLYVRGAIGENVAFIFFPLIILAVVKLSRQIRWVGIGAVALSSLVLSHNITTYMFLPLIFLLLLVGFFFNSRKKSVLSTAFLMIFLGLLISSYFWLPALLESRLMKYDPIFDFRDHFPTIRQLLVPYFGYGASVPGPYDGMSFFLGITNLLVLGLGITLLLWRWHKYETKEKVILVWATISLLAVFLMMNHRSTFIWEKIPLLTFFQFPWRFLMITTLSTPILIIVLGKIPFSNILALGLMVATVGINFSYFRPEHFLGRMDEYYLKRYIPTPKTDRLYLEHQEEYLRLPQVTQVRPDKVYPRVFSQQEGIAEVIEINDLETLIKTSSDKDLVINYNKYFFPGWMAEIDGKRVEILPGRPFGQITFSIPPGTHQVKVGFEETIFKKVLDMVSLTALLFSLWLWWRGSLKWPHLLRGKVRLVESGKFLRK